MAISRVETYRRLNSYEQTSSPRPHRTESSAGCGKDLVGLQIFLINRINSSGYIKRRFEAKERHPKKLATSSGVTTRRCPFPLNPPRLRRLDSTPAAGLGRGLIVRQIILDRIIGAYYHDIMQL